MPPSVDPAIRAPSSVLSPRKESIVSGSTPMSVAWGSARRRSGLIAGSASVRTPVMPSMPGSPENSSLASSRKSSERYREPPSAKTSVS